MTTTLTRHMSSVLMFMLKLGDDRAIAVVTNTSNKKSRRK